MRICVRQPLFTGFPIKLHSLMIPLLLANHFNHGFISWCLGFRPPRRIKERGGQAVSGFESRNEEEVPRLGNLLEELWVAYLASKSGLVEWEMEPAPVWGRLFALVSARKHPKTRDPLDPSEQTSGPKAIRFIWLWLSKPFWDPILVGW